MSWGGEAVWGNLCALPSGLGSASREGTWGGEVDNSTCRGCGTGWDAWGMTCLLPVLLWDLLGWHPGVGAQLEGWYSARPYPADGHHSCQAEKETKERLRLRGNTPCALEKGQGRRKGRTVFAICRHIRLHSGSGLAVFWSCIVGQISPSL